MIELFGISIEVYVIIVILGIPIFFVWRWIFRKFIKSDRKRKIVLWITTIFSTPLIYVGLAILIFSIIEYYPNRDFDKGRWLNDRETRYELSKNIIESKMLIGKTKTEIRRLLGDESNKDDVDQWQYYLGFKPEILDIDPSTLIIDFKNDRVINVEQQYRE